MKHYIALHKSEKGGTATSMGEGNSPIKLDGVEQFWSFEVEDDCEATLIHAKFSWILSKHGSLQEAIKSIRGNADPGLLPTEETVKNLVRENHTFEAIRAIRTLKCLGLKDVYDELDRVRQKLD